MPYIKSLRDLRIASKTGHVVLVKALAPKWIPDEILGEAQALGCVTCDEHGKIVIADGLNATDLIADPDEIPFLSPEDREIPEKRKRVVTMAVLKCFKRNQREDFSSNGVPKAAVITRMIGFQVTAGEVADATEELKGVDD